MQFCPQCSSGPFAHPKLSTSNIPTAIPSFGPGAPPSPTSATSSIPSEKSSRRSSVDLYPTPTDAPQLPTPPASHSNVPSPANSMSPATPPNYEGDSAKIVSSTGSNTMQIPGSNISPPYHVHRRKSSLPISAAHQKTVKPSIAATATSSTLIIPRGYYGDDNNKYLEEHRGRQHCHIIISKTETALLQLANDLGWENWKETHESAKIIQTIPFSRKQKSMGAVICLHSVHYHLFLKGASKILMKKCSRHVIVSKNLDHTQHANSEDHRTLLLGFRELAPHWYRIPLCQ